MECVTDEALERHLLEPSTEVAGHLSACAACAARLSEAEAQGRHFRSFVFPRTVDALLEAASPRRSPGLRWLPLGVAALAASLLAVVLVPWRSGPGEDYVGLKGGGSPELTVFTLGATRQPIEVADGAQLAPSAPLRFRVAPHGDCALWLISLDAHGQVSRIFPTSGAAPHLTAVTELPGGAVLDAASGPERLFAVCGKDDVGFEALEQAALRLGTGPEAVREARALAGLPPGTRQSTLLLEKQP